MMRQNFEVSTCNDALGLEYNLRLHINRPKRCRFSVLQSTLIMCIGVFLGFVVCDLIKGALIQRTLCDSCCVKREVKLATSKPVETEKLVYVGVMTAEKYLNTRAKAVHNSWSRNIHGKVEFFTSAKIQTDLPIVNLAGVADSVYPPQKKSFMMLKYMHDNYIDQYEWFVRADDDVFVHGERLSQFLYSLNSSQRLYIGQAGLGQHAEHGMLGLDPTDNYCMGGTTMIFSRATLRQMVPEINFCIKHLVSTHEDVEIGRCVRKFAHTNCPWAFEFRNLFYQNHEEANGSFTKPGVLNKLFKPITMHPVKDSQHLHRMQAHFLDQKIRDIRTRILLLYRDLKAINKPNHIGFPALLKLDKLKTKSLTDVLPWVFYDKNLYSAWDVNPKRKIPDSMYQGIDGVVSQSMRQLNSKARELGRHIDFRGLLYGYFRLDPLHSADHITDLLLTYHKHKGKNMKIPVRRHSYLHQPFTLPELRFIDAVDSRIHMIVPVKGKRTALIRFLTNYENVALKKRLKTHLIFVNFDANNSANHLRLVTNVERLNAMYQSTIEVLKGEGEFSRAKALQQGALHAPESALLFFIDLDMDFTLDSLNRVGKNTVQGESAYFPVVFSQYNPKLVCLSETCTQAKLSEKIGYWRHFGFGIASIFRSDFLKMGGFDLGIRGWGNEDVDFFDKCVKAELKVYRVPDPGLVHVYHSVYCPNSLPTPQLRMCQGTMASNFASLSVMSQIFYQNASLLDMTRN